jgi:glycosyltransferase involved in cell wall biosynthesis
MRIIGLEPYYGGSHKLFIDGLAARSSHDWRVLGMKPRKWKWRMLHAGAKFAEDIPVLLRGWNSERPSPEDSSELNETISDDSLGEVDDIVFFATDMMNVAEFRGLLPPEHSSIPLVFYFHENQLTYPIEHPKDGDRMFGWINILSAYAADEVWFNSKYHLDAFLEACPRFLRKTPDARPLHMAETIALKSSVLHQGVDVFPPRSPERPPGPLRVLWAARWEYDKNPSLFFDALRVLKSMGVDFTLSVIGDKPERADELFKAARVEFACEIEDWGYLPSREEYKKVLLRSDVAVSTANHEFFGVALAEAVAAGAFPLAPYSLAYPELLDAASGENSDFFHDGTSAGIAEKLAELAAELNRAGTVWPGDPDRGRRAVARFGWERVAKLADKRLSALKPRSRLPR